MKPLAINYAHVQAVMSCLTVKTFLRLLRRGLLLILIANFLMSVSLITWPFSRTRNSLFNHLQERKVTSLSLSLSLSHTHTHTHLLKFSQWTLTSVWVNECRNSLASSNAGVPWPTHHTQSERQLCVCVCADMPSDPHLEGQTLILICQPSFSCSKFVLSLMEWPSFKKFLFPILYIKGRG